MIFLSVLLLSNQEVLVWQVYTRQFGCGSKIFVPKRTPKLRRPAAKRGRDEIEARYAWRRPTPWGASTGSFSKTHKVAGTDAGERHSVRARGRICRGESDLVDTRRRYP